MEDLFNIRRTRPQPWVIADCTSDNAGAFGPCQRRRLSSVGYRARGLFHRAGLREPAVPVQLLDGSS